MRDASELRVREIEGDAWRGRRIVAPLPGTIALAELLELATGGRLQLEPDGDIGDDRVVRFDAPPEARYFLVPRAWLPLLGLCANRDPDVPG